MALVDWPGERLRLRARIDYLESQHQTILKDCSRLRSSVMIMQEQTVRLTDEKSADALRWHDESMRLYEECREMRELAEERAVLNSRGASLVAELREEVALAGKENDRLVASLMEANCEAQRNAEARDDLAGKLNDVHNANGGFLELELEKKKHSVRRLATVASSMLAGAKRKAWRNWLRATAQVRDIFQAAAVAEERAQMKAAMAQLNSDARRIETERRLKRVVCAVRASHLRKGWHTWRQKELAFEQVKITLLSARKVLGRISLATQAAAWNSWIEVAEHSQKGKTAMKRLLRRILRVKEAVGFEVWCRFILSMREVERIAAARAAALRKVVANVASSTAARGLRKWRNCINSMLSELLIAKERAQMKAMMAQSNSDARQIETDRRLKRVVRSVCASHLRKGWHTWRQKELAFVQARTKLRRARKVLGAFLLATQGAAWNSWTGVVEHARVEKKAVKKLLGHILRLKESVGFEAWKKFVLGMHEANRTAAARAAAVRKVVASVVCSTLARGLRQWRDVAKSIHAASIITEERENLRALMAQSSSDALKKETDMRLRRVVNSVCTSRLRKGWHTWRQLELNFERAQTKLRRARKVLGRISLATHAAAWSSWIRLVKHARDEEMAVQKLLRRILRLKEATGLDAWKRRVLNLREAELVAAGRAAAVRKVVGNCMCGTIARGLRHWRDVTKLEIAAEQLATCESMMFQSTANFRRYEVQLKLRRFVSAVCMSHLRKGWQTWRQKELAFERAQITLLSARNVLGRISLAIQAAALSSWSGFVEHAQEGENATKVLLAHICRLKEATGFDAWWQFVINTREAERNTEARAAAVQKVMANVVSSTVARGLRKWCNITVKMLSELAIADERAKMSATMAQSNSDARQIETDRRLKRVVRSVCASHLRKGWHTWRQKELAFVQARTKLRRARKVLGAILLATQTAAWNTWIRVMNHAREKRKAVKKLLGRILRFKEFIGFYEWECFILNVREAERIAAARALALRKVMANVASSTAARGLRKWRNCINTMLSELVIAKERAKMKATMAQSSANARQKEAQLRLRRFVSAARASQLRKGWYTWRQKELACVQARVNLRRVQRVLGHISLTIQAAAWNSWIEVVEHAREEETAMKKLLGRILRLQESTGFDCWKRFIRFMREVERTAAARAAAVRKVMANMVNSTIARGLRKWHIVTNKMQERANMMAMMTQSTATFRHHETQLKLRRVVRAVSASHLRRGWYRWRQKVLAYAQARTKLRTARKILMGISLAAQAAAWNSWIGVVEYSRKEAKEMKMFLERILRLKESMVLDLWKCFVFNTREAERIEAAKAEAVRKVLANAVSNRTARGLRQWRDVTKFIMFEVSLAEEHAKMASVLAHARCVEVHTTVRGLVSQVVRMTLSADDKGKARYFLRWYRFVSSRKEVQAHRFHSVKRLFQFAMSVHDKGIIRSFFKWCRFIVSHREGKTLQRHAFKTIDNVLSLMLHTKLNMAFRTWEQRLRDHDMLRRAFEDRGRAAKTIIRVGLGLANKGMTPLFAFWRWRLYCQVHKQNEIRSRPLLGALRAVFCKRSSRALTAWVRCTLFDRGSAALEGAQQHEAAVAVKVSTERSLAMMTRMARHLLLRKLARTFRCWHVLAHEMWAVWCMDIAAKQRRQVELMRAAVVRCRRFRLSLGWAIWRHLRHQALVAFQSRVLASKGVRSRAACRKVVAVRNRPLRYAFVRLVQNAKGRRAKLAKVAVVAQWLEGEVVRLRLRCVAAGWQRWRQVLESHLARGRGLEAAMRAALRRNGRDVAACFARWGRAVQAAHRNDLAIVHGIFQLKTLARSVQLRHLHSRWAIWKQLHVYEATVVKIHRLESRVVALLKEVVALEKEAAHPEEDAFAACLIAAGRAALAAAWSAIGELQSRGSAQQAQAKVVLADREAAAFEAAAAKVNPTKLIRR